MKVYEAGFHGSYSGLFPHENMANDWAARLVRHRVKTFGSSPDDMWRDFYCFPVEMDEFAYCELFNGQSRTFFDPG